MNKRHYQILLVLHGYHPGSMTGLQVARTLGWSFWRLPPYEALHDMEELGLVHRIPIREGKPTFWGITFEGRRQLAAQISRLVEDI